MLRRYRVIEGELKDLLETPACACKSERELSPGYLFSCRRCAECSLSERSLGSWSWYCSRTEELEKILATQGDTGATDCYPEDEEGAIIPSE